MNYSPVSKNTKCKSSRGFTTLMVIGFMGIFLVILGSVTGYALQQARYGRALLSREQALSIAEAGLEYYRWYLVHAPAAVLDTGAGLSSPQTYDVSDPEGGALGSALVTATPELQCGKVQWVDVESKGTALIGPEFPRTLNARFMRPSSAEYSYVVGENVWAGSDRNIKGPYHSNGGVLMDGTNNSSVTSGVDTWWCDSSFSSSRCATGAYKPGVWGNGPGSSLWKYKVPTIDFAGMGVNLTSLRATVIAGGGIHYDPASGSANSRGYHLIFNSDGTVTVRRVTSTTAVSGYSTQDGTQTEYNIIAGETTLGTYAIPASCSVIYTEDRTWIEGVVKGKVTVAVATPDSSTPDVILRGNITYASNDGSNGLTVIAERNILIPMDSPNVMEIHGIFIAQNGRYGRNYYWTGTSAQNLPSQLTTIGTVVSFRRTGTSWTSGGTVVGGYQTRYDYYDRILAFSPPPFTSFVSSDYGYALWREE